jgi:hypothetical protein
MADAYLEYPLEKGYIHNWLVLGPQATHVADLERYPGSDFKVKIAQAYYPGTQLDFIELPAEQAAIKLGDFEGTWKYVHTRSDHFVDLSIFYHICHYLRSWAYVEVASPEDQDLNLVLTTNGPADVWVNGQHVHRQEHFHHQIPLSVPFQARFIRGYNKILVRFEEVAARECPYSMALRIHGLPESNPAAVRLPTTIEKYGRRQMLERVFDNTYLKQDVYNDRDQIEVNWPVGMKDSANIAARLQTSTGRIYAENLRMATGGNRVGLGVPLTFPDGEFEIFMMPRPAEFYEGGMRISRSIPLRILKNKYSSVPYGTYQERQIEGLLDASYRNGLNVFAEIAKMAIAHWKRIDTSQILKTIESINSRADCSDFYLCGLLGMKLRFEDDPNYPEEIKQPLEDCILNFKYWDDEPGSDSMCYGTENHSILFHTCEILAGQLYPERVFSNNGQTGAWHRQTGEQRALGWLRQRASQGFLEWDSNCYFEEDVLALTHLSDLAESDEVWEMASVVLDKMFLVLAINSYKGTFGSTHGRTYTQFIKGGFFEATAGMSRLAWGMGVFNDHIMGVVAIATSEYQVPDLIASIAADQLDEVWNRERILGSEEDFRASGSRGTGVNKVTYKTPDYMLASAQDWHPGEPGYQQHIWQATLGPAAVVFVTHPTCADEGGSHRPNYWHGNAILPRTAQYKDVLVSVHNLPVDDWMGFTHAYFPAAAFDEQVLRDGWAFARTGEGYLAITAARGIELVTLGDNAFRELRSDGVQNVWLVQMGRAALDGSFTDFQEKVLARPLTFGDLDVRYETLRGQVLTFGWQGPLALDGEAQPLNNFKHMENPYCVVDFPVSSMEVTYGDLAMRLVFEKSQEEA